jgi:FecR protein
MNYLRIVGRTSLGLLFAGAVLTAQASPQVSEQSPPPPGQYDSDQTPVPLDTPDYSDDVPAHIAIVDGAATIERDGRVETAEENIILLAGDRLRTERGRVEILFADGSALDLDHFTRLDLMSDSLLRLLAGRVRLTIARSTSVVDYRVDAAPGSVWIKTAGDYRLTIADTRSGEQELGVTVLRGSAELRNPHGMTLVRAGTYAAVTASTAPSLPFVTNSASFDDFDRWAEDQRDARYGVESVRYLPEEVQYYGGAFDRYGSWDYLPTYGHVWYPRVNAGWRPYYQGRWSFGARFGWSWVGLDRHWGWPTHHYGRWGYSSNRWFWIPGRRWSPAWVSWAYAPGYVSWCPLGFNNRPLISITNVFGRNSWHPWTFVPRRSFGPNVLVTRHAVSGYDIAPGTWRQFAVRSSAPASPTGFVGRAQPLRAPTRGYAVPRGSSVGGPAFDNFGGGNGFATGARTAGQPGPAASPSRLPSRVPQSRATDSVVSDGRANSQAPTASPSRAFPRLSQPSSQAPRPGTSDSPSRTLRARPDAAPDNSGLPRNYVPESRSSSQDNGLRSRVPNGQRSTPEPAAPESQRAQPGMPRNYSPEPRPSNPDSGLRSRVPGTQRSAPEPAAPESQRVQPGTPRNYSPEPRSSSPDSGFRSRVPGVQRSAPERSEPQRIEPRGPSRTAEPRSSGSGGGSQEADRGGFRSRVPQSAAPSRSEPSRSAPEQRAAPSRSGSDGGGRGQAQPSRRGGRG